MSHENKSLDLLGIKGLSDSIRIATERLLDGAEAFLSRVCLPAAEEFGLALRDRVSAWRARNAARMLNTAQEMLLRDQPEPIEQIHPRLVNIAIEEASWTDEDEVQTMWAGLLISSLSHGGASDENLIFMNLLRQLSSLQARILTYSVTTATKQISPQGLPYADTLIVPAESLDEIFGSADFQRLDRELDHLRELGLIGEHTAQGPAGGIHIDSGDANLTPTPLALHLYVRTQGFRLGPAAFWQISQEAPSARDAVSAKPAEDKSV